MSAVNSKSKPSGDNRKAKQITAKWECSASVMEHDKSGNKSRFMNISAEGYVFCFFRNTHIHCCLQLAMLTLLTLSFNIG